jgi:hypothetical protein
MQSYWPHPTTEPDTPLLTANRQRLVDLFNAVAGGRTPDELVFQAAFVAGTVSYDDAVSFVRFAEYTVIATAGKAVGVTVRLEVAD